MRRSLLFFTIVLLFSATGRGQELPRWTIPTSIQVFTIQNTFDASEQQSIAAALESWRPLLPDGLTLAFAGDTEDVQTCQGCVTIVREPTPGKKRGETTLIPWEDGLTRNVVIRIDPRAKEKEFLCVIEHETGHALGLPHYAKSVMQEKSSNRRPAEIDGERLRAIYTLSRYSFRRVVTIGKLRRESVFIYNNNGEQIETEVVGSNDKRFKSVPMFPVGVGSDAVFKDWQTRSAVNQYAVTWADGKFLSLDGAGDKALDFPVLAQKGDIRVEFYYKLFRTSVAIKEVQ